MICGVEPVEAAGRHGGGRPDTDRKGQGEDNSEQGTSTGIGTGGSEHERSPGWQTGAVVLSPTVGTTGTH